MQHSVIKAFVGVVLFLAAGVAGFHFFPEGDNQVEPQSPATLEAVIDDAISAKAQTGDVEPADVADATDAVRDPLPKALRFLSIDSQEQNGDMRACLSFDANFSRVNESELKPFFRVYPDVQFSLDGQDSRICILGLDYGQSYSIDVLKGLTSDEETILKTTRKLSFTFEDKPSFVGFAGEGIILPETKGARVVLKTVNVDRLALTLFRVNDRILSQHSPDAGESGTAEDYVSTYEASSRRVEVWSDEIDVTENKNAIVETPFDLQDKISGKGPGAYILIAEHIVEGEPEYRRAKAIRWLISTDLALSSYRGSDALHVAVRSIKAARLKAGVRLDLVASNNEQLAEVITDSQGRAVFDNAILSGTGPLKPRMIMAYGDDGDYAVLDLSRAPLDLSAMDVQGREITGPFDLYAFTDRGIYRPGQTIRLTTLLRDGDARAIEDRVLALTLTRPDGSAELSRVLKDEDAGGYVTDLTIPAQAARGMWTIELAVEGTDARIFKTVSVEDFVPQRLKLTLKPEKQPVLRAEETRDITLDAQFYYGAPGSNLETEAEVRLQRDPNPFGQFKAYSFGDVSEDFRERMIDVKVPATGEDGTALVQLRLSEEEAKSSHPLRASFIAGVSEPGGRYVRENLFIPVRGQETYIGFKSQFGERAERNKPAKIDLVALAASGERRGAKVSWTLNEEDRDYNWYRYRNRWQYRVRTTDIFIDQGEIDITAAAPAVWSKSLNWGRYRLDVKTEAGDTASYRFGVGWSNWGDSDSDAPDRILVGATDLPTKPGGAVTLNLNAPYAGRGDIVIADYTVRSIRTIDVPQGASSVRIPYDPSWGHDVYAMVTLYTPLDSAKRDGVKRAVGLTHIALDRGPQTLELAINTPDRVSPRTNLQIPIELSGASAQETAWISLAAVDEGILALTKFQSPDAPAAFFAKKAFTLDIRDDYSRILNPFLANGPTRSGGDSIGGAGLSVVPTKTVALYEGPVLVKDGKAVISLDLPDFNGELRIMATAWTKSAIGSASTPIKVRDAVPANLALPRFLAPGDKAVATLSLDNIDGEGGAYRTIVSGEGLLSPKQTVFDLTPGTRDQTGINLSAEDVGIYSLTSDISGPKNYSIQSTYPIEVRSPYRPITRRLIRGIDPGETYTLTSDILDGYSVAGADLELSVSRLPGLSVKPYLAALNRYPYGCTEQTVSKAMPLLFVKSLGGFKDTSERELRDRIQAAIAKVASRQDVTGEFGLWRQGDGNLSPWLQLYVSEFLVEADREGYDVASSSLTSAINAAKMLSRMEDYSSLNLDFPNTESRKDGERQRAERAAYAHYVMALAGEADASGIRYLDKAFGDKLTDPLAMSYLGAALERIGDEARADKMFARAYAALGEQDSYNYYSSAERDAAALLAIGGSSLDDEITEKVLLGLIDLDPTKTSTQEKSYIVRAMSKLNANSGEVKVETKNLTLENKATSFLGTDLVRSPSVKNTGDAKAFVTLDITSTPETATETVSAGFAVTKTLYTPKGTEISPSGLKKGDRAIVLVTAKSKFTADSMVVIADLLPAGLEIETLLSPSDAGKEGAFAFLGELSDFDMQEARDDRFIASDRRTRYDREGSTFRAAYVVRAVTTGSFAFPGAVVEDMYRPARVGTSEYGQLDITDSGAL
ncbi:alpha-2-macroglobulin [Litorimonas cladophorae]|uniref:Alpha-2-macroglobulin n=1 Tax=Litorimonas cladophorae TaxID=1220491 RepID=A0A918NDB6_9PROT|nr:alpha-2-macroglobulin [Litorimonas cladophorae]GGX59097.1 alpha-2-macroglobulin [Litorimonas cladophorae]